LIISRKLAVACRWKSGPGSCQEAFERALAIREARLADHPDTARTQQNLAAVVSELENRR
jgi:hypothetical protein